MAFEKLPVCMTRYCEDSSGEMPCEQLERSRGRALRNVTPARCTLAARYEDRLGSLDS